MKNAPCYGRVLLFRHCRLAAHHLLKDRTIYLELELTVERLAKRHLIPARALPVAINQTIGMNVSQYLNEFRLRQATDLLATSRASLAQIMEQSGPLTRSNF